MTSGRAMERQKERANKYGFYKSKYSDRWATKQIPVEDEEDHQEKTYKRRQRNVHKVRESSWVSQSTPLEDLVSLSPRMKATGKNLFAFHAEDKYSKLFDETSSDEKEEGNNDIEEEEEKIILSPSKQPVSTITKETLRVHQARMKQRYKTNNEEGKKEDSQDSFTSISTDIQNAIHYDLLENEIYHT